MTVDEKWLPVSGYEGLYEVSDLGRVKSLGRTYIDSIGRHTTKKGRILVQNIQNGYKVVCLVGFNKDNKNKTVHRIVATAFIPNPENKPQVNHKDLDKTNNHISNLEWSTMSENIRHRIESYTHKDSNIVGVRYIKLSNQWNAAIYLDGKYHYLGTYKNKLEAKKVFEEAETNYNNEGTLPKYRNPKYTSKYKFVFLSKKNNTWGFQFRNPETGERYSEEGYKNEELAYKAYTYTYDLFKTTGIFPKHTCKSKYKYVSWKESLQKWQATAIIENNKKKYLGVFVNEEDAAKAVMDFYGFDKLQLR